MRHLVLRSIIGSLVVSSAAIAYADSPLPAAPPATSITWMPVTGMDHQIFPSATISTATSKFPFVYLLVKMSHVPAGARVHVAVKCESLMDPSSADVVTAKEESALTVPIKANWKFDRLSRVRQQIPVNFTYSLSIDGGQAEEKTDTAIVHSVNDCIFWRRDDAGRAWPLYALFTAYVNEDHPKIDRLLRDALETGIVRQFDGYQENNPKQVIRQVFSVWQVLEMKGVKYSSITAVPDKSDVVRAQHVRFLDESVDNAEANCVDGSIIFASVLQKIGIDAALVIKPGHMFVLFYTEPNRKGYVALETTLVGRVDLSHPRAHPLRDLLDPKWRSKASAMTFEAAIQAGGQEFAKLVEASKKQKDEHTNEFVGGVIHISDARKAGILPIPYDFTKESSGEPVRQATVDP